MTTSEDNDDRREAEARRRDRRLSLPLNDTELPLLQVAPVAPETKRGRRIALTIVVIACFIAVAWIASPIWVGLALGTVMAFTAQPLYRKLAGKNHQYRVLAAAVTTLVGGILTAAAGATCIYVMTRELILLVDLFQRKMASGSLGELIGERNARALDHLGIHRAEAMAKIRHELSAATEYATGAVGVILQATSSAVLGLIIALMTMYYVLLEWPTIAVRLERILPLDPRHTRALMLEFRDVGRSSFVGTIATAIVQGTLAGVGYGIAGVSNAVTLAILTALASFLPLVGTALVWAAVAIYLIATGQILAAVFVLGWGLVVVMALADYVIRPRLVGGKDHGHPLLMLIALLGGIEVFGLAGLIVAPMMMSLFLAALRIFERELDAEAAANAIEPPPQRRASDGSTADGL
jgi:predicted PurR-regulated permease PerM